MMLKHNKGVTLIELMIVLVIAAMLVGGIYTLFATQQRSYFVQDRVSGIQQDARAALDIMARDIRVAGCLIGSQGFNINGAQFAVTRNNNTGGPDSITVAAAADAFMDGVTPVTVQSVIGNVVNLSDNVGSFFDTGINSFVAFEGDGKNTLYQITGASPASPTLTLDQSPPTHLATISSSTGARVFRAKAITYSVTTADGVLRRNDGSGAQPLAGDGETTVVEDLQFAYQVAGSTDWIFDADTSTWPTGTTNADIRMVRISLVVRTAVPDPEDTTFTQPPLEDHTGSLAGPDGFRRRVYTTVVKVRNL